ncbi:uracil-DNA glycosylase [Bacillus coahuilensis m2-6]|uniref:hypothetical protein n=1 Tax=Bacillus coahuilensis TaxID=408580 RepID=UPI00018513C2|nr:hypothetical protein [Bacillus coahuilensis]KUP04984.1 uracil-DNA glycosylase [Bacillus coahuilensis m2-6]
MEKPINCLQCQYFYVTWEQHHSRGCKAHGFKSKQLPSLVVKKASGQACHAFTKKNTVRS